MCPELKSSGHICYRLKIKTQAERLRTMHSGNKKNINTAAQLYNW